MIVEINKVYVLSAPKAAAGMTSRPDDFLIASSPDMPFVKFNKVDSAMGTKHVVRMVGKVFEHKGQPMQAVCFYFDLPESMVKQKIVDKVNQVTGAAPKPTEPGSLR